MVGNRRNILNTSKIIQFTFVSLHSVHALRLGAWGGVVVKALRYKSEGRGIDSRCRQGFFSVASDGSMCPGVDSASKNEYKGVKAAGA
jgi:hypothetical protein